MSNQFESIDADLYISFIGAVNAITTGRLIQIIQTCSRPVLTPPNKKINIKEVYLFINSMGGALECANSAYQSIKAFQNKLKIYTYNIGCVDSSAVAIFCLGNERYALSKSRFIIHESAMNITGELKRIKDSIKGAEDSTEQLASIITETCGRKLEDVREHISRHKYLDSEEAKKYGLVTAIMDSLPVPSSENDIVEMIASNPR